MLLLMHNTKRIPTELRSAPLRYAAWNRVKSSTFIVWGAAWWRSGRHSLGEGVAFEMKALDFRDKVKKSKSWQGTLHASVHSPVKLHMNTTMNKTVQNNSWNQFQCALGDVQVITYRALERKQCFQRGFQCPERTEWTSASGRRWSQNCDLQVTVLFRLNRILI